MLFVVCCAEQLGGGNFINLQQLNSGILSFSVVQVQCNGHSTECVNVCVRLGYVCNGHSTECVNVCVRLGYVCNGHSTECVCVC